jgi:hypothetical protein
LALGTGCFSRATAELEFYFYNEAFQQLRLRKPEMPAEAAKRMVVGA